jgi:hypothetical protein
MGANRHHEGREEQEDENECCPFVGKQELPGEEWGRIAAASLNSRRSVEKSALLIGIFRETCGAAPQF